MARIDDRAFAGQPFNFAQEGFQIIERNVFIFVIGGIETEILPCFGDKILCLIFHDARPQEMISAPEQASSERIRFALVISRIEIVIQYGCFLDDADHAIIFCIFKTVDYIPVRKIDHRLVKHDYPVTAESIQMSVLPSKADFYSVRRDVAKAGKCTAANSTIIRTLVAESKGLRRLRTLLNLHSFR